MCSLLLYRSERLPIRSHSLMHLHLRKVAGTYLFTQLLYQSQRMLSCSTPHYKFHPAQYFIWLTAVAVCVILAKLHFSHWLKRYGPPLRVSQCGIWHMGRESLWMRTVTKNALHCIQFLASEIRITEQATNPPLVVDFAFKNPTLMSVYSFHYKH